MPKLRLSYSSLQFYFESGCPAAWKFRQEMRPKAIHPFAATGILVHSVMAQEKKIEEVEDKNVLMYVKKLRELANTTGIVILKREFWRTVDIMPGVEWVAKIDFRGTNYGGQDILGDWKTTGNGWKHPLDGQISPVARSFQGSGYLTRGNEKKWPRMLYNFVVGFRGPGEVIIYRYNEKDDENLKEAIQVVKKQKRFPKVYGKHCLGVKPDGSDKCDFFAACFKTKDWEDEYTQRDEL